MATENEKMKSLFDRGKPVTVWEVAAKLGKGHTDQAPTILNRLASQGVLAKFRVGFNHYYAFPNVALIGEKPTLGTVTTDSLKNLLLNLRYRINKKLN